MGLSAKMLKSEIECKDKIVYCFVCYVVMYQSKIFRIAKLHSCEIVLQNNEIPNK